MPVPSRESYNNVLVCYLKFFHPLDVILVNANFSIAIILWNIRDQSVKEAQDFLSKAYNFSFVNQTTMSMQIQGYCCCDML